MAKEKRAPFRMVAIHAEENKHGRIDIILPEDVMQDRPLMLRLHHRVVDLLDENGILGYFADDVEKRLAALGPGIISDFIADLLKESQQPVEQ